MFWTVEPSGSPENRLHWLQTCTVAPGDGAIFELTIPEAGQYPFVDHSIEDLALGAMGILRVSAGAQGGPLAP